LTYNTATGRTVIHSYELIVAVLLLLETTSGARGIATTQRKSSVKVSS